MENTAHHSTDTPSYDSITHLICASSQLAVSLAAHPSVANLSSNTVQKIGLEWGVHRDYLKNMCFVENLVGPSVHGVGRVNVIEIPSVDGVGRVNCYRNTWRRRETRQYQRGHVNFLFKRPYCCFTTIRRNQRRNTAHRSSMKKLRSGFLIRQPDFSFGKVSNFRKNITLVEFDEWRTRHITPQTRPRMTV